MAEIHVIVAGQVGTLDGAPTAEVADSDAHEALTEFISAHHGALVRTLSLYVGDRSVAEDLAQEALARAVRDWKRVAHLEAPHLWVRRVAFNLANSHFRRRAASRRAQARLVGANPAESTVVDSDALAVRRAVAQLDPKQRTAIVLRYFDDLAVSAVAEIMNCPEGTVRSLTSRAIAELRRLGLANLEAPDA